MSATTEQPRTFLDVAREVMPDASDATLMGYLWEFTGYPEFWNGDPETCCRQQLVEARNSMEAGKRFDLYYGWIGGYEA